MNIQKAINLEFLPSSGFIQTFFFFFFGEINEVHTSVGI